MTMTPIERACIAVIDNLREQGDLMPDCGDPEWAQVDGAFRVEPVVRAVLEAIREPSAGMLESAGEEERWDGKYRSSPENEAAADAIWRTMVDTALAEG